MSLPLLWMVTEQTMTQITLPLPLVVELPERSPIGCGYCYKHDRIDDCAHRLPQASGTTEGIVSVRNDFIAFCEAVSERPLTAQQRLLAEVLSEQQKSMR